MSSRREFAYTDADFDALRSRVLDDTGIRLGDSKRELVYGRVTRRLRALGLDSFSAYRALLEQDDGREREALRSAITTKLTAFNRERHHFDYLRDQLLRPWVEAGARERLRIWSAGCASGEEPYSIAMTIAACVPHWQGRDIRILATDIDAAVLEYAQAAVYTQAQVARVPPADLERHFTRLPQDGGVRYRLRPQLAGLVTLRQLNLVDELPMHGPLDAIFCRNVAIYFDRETQRRMYARFARLQRPGDLLFVGHSESLYRVTDDYALIGKTIYRRR
ncbi:MAG: protein-glutamate O-methyltransferase CheR [Steroidobacteraceae bacterium]|nr:protein-glutamate O-methyltransferase CheR [Steroidobacteraceae bacterium]